MVRAGRGMRDQQADIRRCGIWCDCSCLKPRPIGWSDSRLAPAAFGRRRRKFTKRRCGLSIDFCQLVTVRLHTGLQRSIRRSGIGTTHGFMLPDLGVVAFRKRGEMCDQALVVSWLVAHDQSLNLE